MPEEIRKVSLIGLGAMGSFFAPGLSKAFGSGFRVVAEGKRRERLEKQGVTINGKTYRFGIVSPDETGDPADLIIVATKNYSLDQATADIKNQVGERTLILPVMNGVDSEEKLISVYGAERVMYSYMRMSIVMKDGVTDYDPGAGAVHFGEKLNREGAYSERVLAVKRAMEAAGVRYIIDPDMVYGIWHKFVSNVGENLTCALLGVPFGFFRISDDANALREAGMRETRDVAAAEAGVVITDEALAELGRRVKLITPENKPSTLQDIEAKRKTEIDTFAGEVVRLGKKHGIATPVCECFLHGIRVLEQKYETPSFGK